jgi:DNA modification methylase
MNEKKLYVASYTDTNKNNIGNLKKQTYLEAMFQVYAESFKVLKPNGKMILIVKNFIRKKKVIPLTEHTIAICEKAGFKLIDRLKFKLPTRSFWRTLYSKKYPEVDTTDLNYEHILVFEKR